MGGVSSKKHRGSSRTPKHVPNTDGAPVGTAVGVSVGAAVGASDVGAYVSGALVVGACVGPSIAGAGVHTSHLPWQNSAYPASHRSSARQKSWSRSPPQWKHVKHVPGPAESVHMH